LPVTGRPAARRDWFPGATSRWAPPWADGRRSPSPLDDRRATGAGLEHGPRSMAVALDRARV